MTLPARYIVETRYQDCGWSQDTEPEPFASIDDAMGRALEMNHNPMVYGMVRIVDAGTREVVVTFPAG